MPGAALVVPVGNHQVWAHIWCTDVDVAVAIHRAHDCQDAPAMSPSVLYVCHACMYRRMCVCMSVRAYVCTYVCMHACMHVCASWESQPWGGGEGVTVAVTWLPDVRLASQARSHTATASGQSLKSSGKSDFLTQLPPLLWTTSRPSPLLEVRVKVRVRVRVGEASHRRCPSGRRRRW